ncbi:GSCFA domain-containing protein [Sulfitobacter aestuariivivens]|uniref:GSCFA domain-containing protein n=1 Tax=Sulfitobacter aestuariivivens TaxID=2766981 RepID=A0A927D0X9_9RHOB|nr:GSCFA domain-containing protein [Sulfitobacter aestuariivivens]MBD3662406.1 GSCFA domain-containing protein [Sulfitobacter aestuariivivens]
MSGKTPNARTRAAPQPNPYTDLDDKAFWKTAVAGRSAFDIEGLWQPKFRILPKHRIVTAGSCFAQHIGRALAARRYHWVDAEPAPLALSAESRKHFNYGVFSFRTGNIYTATALLQWVSWAFGEATPPTEVWEKDGRFYDPFRPAIEPGGFENAQELFASREVTLAAIRRAVRESDIFVFTMGLTEAWYNLAAGHEYAMCPGTLAGTFDPAEHAFRNQPFNQIRRDLRAALNIMRGHNRGLRFLLTVSPVPLTATASGEHVLTATTLSKSTLRAVAGDMVSRSRFTDYFPSYEIITSCPYRGMFYEPNMRSVSPHGVAHVMNTFFADQAAKFGAQRYADNPQTEGHETSKDTPPPSVEDLVCEEEMLNAFQR